jgi:hypothetical protein
MESNDAKLEQKLRKQILLVDQLKAKEKVIETMSILEKILLEYKYALGF